MRFVTTLVTAVVLIAASALSSAPAEARGRGVLASVYNLPLSAEMDLTSPWLNPRHYRRPCLVRTYGQLDQDFGVGSAGPRCQKNHFLVHYQGFIRVPTTGTYTFFTINDDGFRLTIGTEVVINTWYDQGPGEFGDFNAEGSVSLLGNWRYKLDAWLYENGGGAEAHLYYALGESEAALVPSSWLSTP